MRGEGSCDKCCRRKKKRWNDQERSLDGERKRRNGWRRGQALGGMKMEDEKVKAGQESKWEQKKKRERDGCFRKKIEKGLRAEGRELPQRTVTVIHKKRKNERCRKWWGEEQLEEGRRWKEMEGEEDNRAKISISNQPALKKKSILHNRLCMREIARRSSIKESIM